MVDEIQFSGFQIISVYASIKGGAQWSGLEQLVTFSEKINFRKILIKVNKNSNWKEHLTLDILKIAFFTRKKLPLSSRCPNDPV